MMNDQKEVQRLQREIEALEDEQNQIIAEMAYIRDRTRDINAELNGLNARNGSIDNQIKENDAKSQELLRQAGLA